MHYLVTGGAGFIGSHLCELLLKQGHKVTILDDLSTGSIRNIEHLKPDKNFAYRIDTITNVPVLSELVEQSDIIVHLAAAVGVQLVIESPVRTIHTNVDGASKVLQEANKYKKKLLIASTSEVYGKSNKIPFREDDDILLGPPNKRRWCYASSKALDEFLAMAYWYENKLPVVICRLFNTVGPRQIGRYGMVIPRFIKQALSQSPITIYGEGKQTRCFTYVSEVCEAIYRLSLEEKAIGEIFNIGSDQEISILELAQKVRQKVLEKAGTDSEIKFIPYAQAYGEGFEDMERRVPDTQKLYNLIALRPQYTIDQILDAMVDYIARRG